MKKTGLIDRKVARLRKQKDRIKRRQAKARLGPGEKQDNRGTDGQDRT